MSSASATCLSGDLPGRPDRSVDDAMLSGCFMAAFLEWCFDGSSGSVSQRSAATASSEFEPADTAAATAAAAAVTAMQRARVSEDSNVSKSHRSRAFARRWAAVCLTIRTEPKRNVHVLTIGTQNRGILAVGIRMH